MTEERKIEKSHCNECCRETKHFVIVALKTRDSEVFEGQYSVDFSTTHTLLECCGCGEVALRKSFWCSEQFDETSETYYPPRVSRRKPAFFDDLPCEMRALLEEIYLALHADSRRLAKMGARAVIDMFIMNTVGDKGTFAGGMGALESEGYISQKSKEIILAAIEAGHAAAHRGHVPSSKNLSAVIDIIENLIQHDLLSASAESLRKTTPTRKPREVASQEKM